MAKNNNCQHWNVNLPQFRPAFVVLFHPSRHTVPQYRVPFKPNAGNVKPFHFFNAFFHQGFQFSCAQLKRQFVHLPFRRFAERNPVTTTTTTLTVVVVVVVQVRSIRSIAAKVVLQQFALFFFVGQ